MTENDYFLAWGIYAFAALGCILVWFRITRWMWRYLREPLRLLGAVLLLTPTVVDPAKDLLAPAVAISALELVFKMGGSAWGAISDLAMAAVIALGLYVVFALVRLPFLRKAKARRQAQAQAAAAAQADTDEAPLQPRPDEREQRRPPTPPRDNLRVEPRI
jgi:signal transduction histidine kinase|nr:MFS transporter [Pseudomonas sp. UBA4194]